MRENSLFAYPVSTVRCGLLLIALFISLGWWKPADAQGNTIIRTLAWSPDGSLVASGTESGQVSLWDAQGRHIQQFSSQQSRIIRILWSPNNQFLLSWSTDDRAILWSRDGTLRAIFQHCSWLNEAAIQWSADGEWLAISPDNTLLQIWKTTAAEPGILHAALGVEEAGHDTNLRLTWSPDGTTLAAGNTKTNTVYIWDRQLAVYWAITKEGAVANKAFQILEDSTLSDGLFVQNLAWSPDSQVLAIGYFGWTLQLWSRDRALQTLTKYSSEIDGQNYNVELAWSPDGQLLAFGDRPMDTVNTRIWSADGQSVETIAGGEAVIAGLAWSPRQTLAIVYNSRATVNLWAADKPLRSIQPTNDGSIWGVPTWSFDGAYLSMRYNTVNAGSTIQIWTAEGMPVTTLNDGTGDDNQPYGWSPIRNVIAMRGEGNQIRMVEVSALVNN